MIREIKEEITSFAKSAIFHPDLNALGEEDWELVIDGFSQDYNRYYSGEIVVSKIKYYPGLLATLFYRISRKLYLLNLEKEALEFSSLGYQLTSIELYFSAKIDYGLKINHGMGIVVGSRTEIGKNCLLHQGVTVGEKNGGRARLGDDVIVYPNATIVGEIFIGNGSIVGANVFVDKSYGSNSKIF